MGKNTEGMLICDVVWRIYNAAAGLKWDKVHKTALRCTSLRVRYRKYYKKHTLHSFSGEQTKISNKKQ